MSQLTTEPTTTVTIQPSSDQTTTVTIKPEENTTQEPIGEESKKSSHHGFSFKLLLVLFCRILDESMTSVHGKITFAIATVLFFALQFVVGNLGNDYSPQGLLDISNLNLIPIICMTLAFGFFLFLCFYGTKAETRLIYMKNKYFFGWFLYIGLMLITLIVSAILVDIFDISTTSQKSSVQNAATGLLLIIFSYLIFLFGTVVAETVSAK